MVGSGGGELGICLFLQRHNNREICDFLRLTMKKINFGHYLSKKKNCDFCRLFTKNRIFY